MKRRAWLVFAVVIVLLVGSAWLLVSLQAGQKLGRPGLRVVAEPIYDPDGKIVGTNSIYLPARVLDYQSEPLPVTRLELDWLPPDTTYGRRLYKAPDGFTLMASVVLMGTDRTSIHKPEFCLEGQGFAIQHSEVATVPIGQSHPYPLPIRKLITTRKIKYPDGQMVEEKGIYVYWFVADDQVSALHWQRMWWMARDLIRDGVLQRWAYVGCFAVCQPGQEAETLERITQFIAASVPQFQLASGAGG